MRKITLLGASALVLVLGLVSASAEPFNPVYGYTSHSSGAAVLQQYHEGK